MKSENERVVSPQILQKKPQERKLNRQQQNADGRFEKSGQKEQRSRSIN